MGRKSEDELYQTLSDTQQLLKGLDPDGERYTLESILAEFGAGGDAPQQAKAEPEHAAEAPSAQSAPVMEAPLRHRQSEQAGAEDAPLPAQIEPLPTEPPAMEKPAEPPAPEPTPPLAETAEGDELPFEHLVAETVNAVMEEKAERRSHASPRELLSALLQKSRRSRRKAAAEELPSDATVDLESAEADSWADEPEPAAEESYELYRRQYAGCKQKFRLSLFPAGLSLLLTAADYFALLPAALTAQMRSAASLALLALTLIFALEVLRRAVDGLRQRRFTAELLALLSCVAAAADGAAALLAPQRGYGAMTCAASLALSFALAGAALESRARRDSFRLLAMGEPNYVVAEGEAGILKRKGGAEGFYHCTVAQSAAERWQGVLLPLIFAAATLFAALAAFGGGAGKERFLWVWSVLLAVAASFALPLCTALPAARIARRLQKAGAALAGCFGARFISRSRRVILTDHDLFPEGTVHLNGIKIYGEEVGKVVSYAASLARATDSGISHLFDSLLQSEGALPQKLDEFAFSKDGGVSAVIHGETTLLGGEKFLRRAGVVIPHDVKLKTGLFLSIDKRVAAVFAVKYPAVESVDWALHGLKRNHIQPVLASRDANLTPALLKRKFDTDAKAVYPPLAERLALSDENSREVGRMGAVLYREGLMPYAEAVIAARRLCRAARGANFLALIGSIASVLLCFYLTFLGACETLTPFSVAVYQLLWALPALLIGENAARY